MITYFPKLLNSICIWCIVLFEPRTQFNLIQRDDENVYEGAKKRALVLRAAKRWHFGGIWVAVRWHFGGIFNPTYNFPILYRLLILN